MEDQKALDGDSIKNPLKNLRSDFYEATSKISDLIRTFAFAGIGIIWIFKTSNINGLQLPKVLKFPLSAFIIYFLHDVGQYLWRAINFYYIYRKKEKDFDEKIITENEIADIKIPDYIAIGTWSFFIFKILYVIIAYISLYNFLKI